MSDALPVSTTGRTALGVARACAAEARRVILEGYGRVGDIATKGRGNVVTDIDYAVEAAVRRILEAEYPAHAILSEETAAETRSDGWMWVVDPVDGTKNFSRGIPHFCFTIALCRATEPVVALTLHPLLNEEYAAVAGAGFTVNGRPATVTACQSVREAVVAVDLGYDEAAGTSQLDLVRGLFPGMQSLRISGSAALGSAYLAAGKWDLFVHGDLQPWDVAAGLLLVREAGGIVTNHAGAPASIYDRGIVAAPPAVLADFFRLAPALGWPGSNPGPRS
jgi:myo-inositol-1(or 4)-monophosphatase